MNRSLFLLAAPALLALASHGAHAAPTVYKFCGSDGPYGDVATQVAKYRTSHVQVQAVNDSKGTKESIERLFLPKDDPRSCDAMIGQPDGYAYLQKNPGYFHVQPGDVAKMEDRVDYHAEFVQIVCNADRGMKNIYNATNKDTIALGQDGSGAWLWWKTAISVNPAYGKLPTVQAERDDAITRVAKGLTTCMVRVSGVPDPVIQKADQDYGKKLQMVQVYDNAFVTPKGADGKPIYEWAKVQRESYPTVLDWASFVWVVKEPAHGYVNVDKVAPDDLADVIEAMGSAAPYAKSKYGE